MLQIERHFCAIKSIMQLNDDDHDDSQSFENGSVKIHGDPKQLPFNPTEIGHEIGFSFSFHLLFFFVLNFF